MTTTTNTPIIHTEWFQSRRIDGYVLNYYEVPSHYGAYGPFFTIEEAMAFAKSRVRLHEYADARGQFHTAHTREHVRLRRITDPTDLDYFERRGNLTTPDGLPLSPTVGDIVGSIEIFLSAQEVDALAVFTNTVG